jgi:hypothetical protein
LIPATDHRSGYLWAEAEGRRLLGKALLARAVRTKAAEERHAAGYRLVASGLSSQSLLNQAREELTLSLNISTKIGNPAGRFSQELLHKLDLGGYMSLTNGTDTATSSPVRIFVSYSHLDKRWIKEIDRLLAPLVMRDDIEIWSDVKITAGMWENKIKASIAKADLAILLVIMNFLASRFIKDNELPPLLKRLGDTDKVFWIPISASTFWETPLRDYQAACSPDEPLDGMKPAKRKMVLVEIARKITDEVRKIQRSNLYLDSRPS